MPQSVSEQSDAFEQLLAEALRAGPGSGQWQQALEAVRAAGGEGAAGKSPVSVDQAAEYQLLLAARERLESGREYRTVRAGPQFTRQVMQQVDDLSASRGRKKWSRGRVLSWLGAATIVIVLLVVVPGFFVPPIGPQARAMSSLRSAYFVQERLASDFSRTTDEHWKPLGNLPMQNLPWWGLRPDGAAVKSALGTSGENSYLAGGVVLAEPLPADAQVKIEVKIRPGKMGAIIQPQIFLSDQRDFSSERAASSHEFTWLVKADGNAVVVTPSGQFAQQQIPIRQGREPVTVTLMVNKLAALVECEGRQLYFDRLSLDEATPRYLGVRFVVNTSIPIEQMEDLPSLLSVKILNAK